MLVRSCPGDSGAREESGNGDGDARVDGLPGDRVHVVVLALNGLAVVPGGPLGLGGRHGVSP